MEVHAKAKEASIQAIVIRCTCGIPDSHFGEPCARGKQQNLGTISYWNRNPLKRWLWAAKQTTRGK